MVQVARRATTYIYLYIYSTTRIPRTRRGFAISSRNPCSRKENYSREITKVFIAYIWLHWLTGSLFDWVILSVTWRLWSVGQDVTCGGGKVVRMCEKRCKSCTIVWDVGCHLVYPVRGSSRNPCCSSRNPCYWYEGCPKSNRKMVITQKVFDIF